VNQVTDTPQPLTAQERRERDTLYLRIHAIPTLPHYGRQESCWRIADAVRATLNAARAAQPSREAGIGLQRLSDFDRGYAAAIAAAPAPALDVLRAAIKAAALSPLPLTLDEQVERIAAEYARLSRAAQPSREALEGGR